MPGCRGAAFFRRGKTQGTPHGVPFFVGHTATVLGNNLPGTGLYPAAVAAYPGMHRTTVRPPAVICRSGRALPGCADGKRSASLGSLPGHGGSGPSMPGIRHNRGTTGWEEYGQDTESRGVQEGTGKDGGVGTGRHRPRTGGHPGPPGIWRDSRAGLPGCTPAPPHHAGGPGRHPDAGGHRGGDTGRPASGGASRRDPRGPVPVRSLYRLPEDGGGPASRRCGPGGGGDGPAPA